MPKVWLAFLLGQTVEYDMNLLQRKKKAICKWAFNSEQQSLHEPLGKMQREINHGVLKCQRS